MLVNTPGEKKLPLAKVVQVCPGKDGQVREVTILKEGRIARITINKLVPLEISQKEVDRCDLPSVKSLRHRPKRFAAMKADSDRRPLIEEDAL